MRSTQCRNLVIAMFGSAVVAFLAAGCDSAGTADEQARHRQDQALNDPMNYSPDMDDVDVTGGSIGNYDDKGMKRDLNDLLNP
jgi:hypothetical protein